MLKQHGLPELSFFEPLWVGLPAAVVGATLHKYIKGVLFETP